MCWAFVGMHSPSPSAAPLLVFIWCCGQVIKGGESTEREWLYARLSPGLSQCRLRPVPGEGKGGRGVHVARDHAITCPGSQQGLHCLPCAVKPHLWASELFLLQSYFCFVFASPLWLPLEAKSSKAESCFRWLCWWLTRSPAQKTRRADFLPQGCCFRWDYL